MASELNRKLQLSSLFPAARLEPGKPGKRGIDWLAGLASVGRARGSVVVVGLHVPPYPGTALQGGAAHDDWRHGAPLHRTQTTTPTGDKVN